jgi:hypothetical protein
MSISRKTILVIESSKEPLLSTVYNILCTILNLIILYNNCKVWPGTELYSVIRTRVHFPILVPVRNRKLAEISYHLAVCISVVNVRISQTFSAVCYRLQNLLATTQKN